LGGRGGSVVLDTSRRGGRERELRVALLRISDLLRCLDEGGFALELFRVFCGSCAPNSGEFGYGGGTGSFSVRLRCMGSGFIEPGYRLGLSVVFGDGVGLGAWAFSDLLQLWRAKFWRIRLRARRGFFLGFFAVHGITPQA